MNIYEKLLNIQIELKAPKGQFNSFGKYNYRSCEDILEAIKPICYKHKVTLLISDRLISVNERYYVEACVQLINYENLEETITVTASAREEENKKGMDGAQVTGASSSYARKYALNGMFAIDDTKDSDSTNTGDDDKVTTKNTESINKFKAAVKNTNKFNRQSVISKMLEMDIEKIEGALAHFKVESFDKLTDNQLIMVKKQKGW